MTENRQNRIHHYSKVVFLWKFYLILSKHAIFALAIIYNLDFVSCARDPWVNESQTQAGRKGNVGLWYNHPWKRPQAVNSCLSYWGVYVVFSNYKCLANQPIMSENYCMLNSVFKLIYHDEWVFVMYSLWVITYSNTLCTHKPVHWQ